MSAELPSGSFRNSIFAALLRANAWFFASFSNRTTSMPAAVMSLQLTRICERMLVMAPVAVSIGVLSSVRNVTAVVAPAGLTLALSM